VEQGVMVSFFNDCDMGQPNEFLCAVQFFGTKGFFPTYDAVPGAPLDRATASLWVDGFCALAAGELEELKLAQAIGRAAGLKSPPMLRGEFRTLLDQRLAAVRERRPGLPALAERQPVLAGDGADHPVTRGEACVLLYMAAESLLP